MDDFVGSADLGRSVEARQALAAVAGLPKRQREYMAVKIAGLSYQEIARLSGRTYTNVTRHLADGGRRTEAPPGAA